MPVYLFGLVGSVKPVHEKEDIMSSPIILTTAMYDLVKNQIHRKRVTREQESRLTEELKNAKQVLRRELPDDVVTVDRRVTIKNLEDGTQRIYHFVADAKRMVSKGRYSILSDIALATIGRRVGDIFDWPFEQGPVKIEIANVELVNQ